MKCEIIRDLFPSYVENLTSKESNYEIDIHLAECRSCQKIINEMKDQSKIKPATYIPQEINYLKKIKKHNLRNILIIGFLSGVLLYLVYCLLNGRIVIGTSIPDYLIARIPYIIFKVIISGFVGSLVVYVISIIKRFCKLNKDHMKK